MEPIDLDDSDDGTGQGDLFKTATFMDGTSFVSLGAGTGANAARGTISLTAEDGGSIIIEDGVAEVTLTLVLMKLVSSPKMKKLKLQLV